jgi:predicted thioesterase
MIGYMERTCRDTVLPLLDPGYDTVGTHVNVAHLAAAPMGMTVTFRAEITAVNERRVEFRVEAWDEKEKIGEGTHQRTIINVAKFATKLAQKKQGSGQ